MIYHHAASCGTVFVASLLFLTCHSSLAQAPSNNPASEVMSLCRDRTDPGDRLSCYDKVGAIASGASPPLLATPPAVNPDLKTVHAWGFRKAINPDGTPDLTIGIAASDVLDYGRFLEKPDATLVIRCSAGQASIYVSFGTRLPGKEVNGTLKIDNGQPREVSWTVSASGTSVGNWKSSDVSKQTARLIGSSVLAISLVIEGGRSIITVFDLTGIKEASAPLRESCHW